MKTLDQNTPGAAALALGSNVGNAEKTFAQACQLLEAHGFTVANIAPVIKTAPVDCPENTPDFANSALTGTFAGTPEELLELTQSIEVQLGRPADHAFHAPRTLDLDIIIFEDKIVRSERLTIPHLRAQERFFVLQPLSLIAPQWQFADSGLTVEQALQKINTDF